MYTVLHLTVKQYGSELHGCNLKISNAPSYLGNLNPPPEIPVAMSPRITERSQKQQRISSQSPSAPWDKPAQLLFPYTHFKGGE